MWNGTNWTEVNDLNLARASLSAVGITTAALAYGGTEDGTSVELWNGTNWITDQPLTTSRSRMGAAGTSTSAIAAGGQTPSITNLTEEWYGDGKLTETFTTS